jgi:hypothetical protein
MAINYRRAHAMGAHNAKPNRFCTVCTQEATAAEMTQSHALGRHKKLPRKKCPVCRAEREAQWQRRATA